MVGEGFKILITRQKIKEINTSSQNKIKNPRTMEPSKEGTRNKSHMEHEKFVHGNICQFSAHLRTFVKSSPRKKKEAEPIKTTPKSSPRVRRSAYPIVEIEFTGLSALVSFL